MKFFTEKELYTHKGSFYGVPVYYDFSDEANPVISGRNIFFTDLFLLMVLFHNNVVELGAQVLSSVMQTPYQPGFPFWIEDELEE